MVNNRTGTNLGPASCNILHWRSNNGKMPTNHLLPRTSTQSPVNCGPVKLGPRGSGKWQSGPVDRPVLLPGTVYVGSPTKALATTEESVQSHRLWKIPNKSRITKHVGDFAVHLIQCSPEFIVLFELIRKCRPTFETYVKYRKIQHSFRNKSKTHLLVILKSQNPGF